MLAALDGHATQMLAGTAMTLLPQEVLQLHEGLLEFLYEFTDVTSPRVGSCLDEESKFVSFKQLVLFQTYSDVRINDTLKDFCRSVVMLDGDLHGTSFLTSRRVR
jgi:hypothetical protein